jgi:hypothetical protein
MSVRPYEIKLAPMMVINKIAQRWSKFKRRRYYLTGVAWLAGMFTASKAVIVSRKSAIKSASLAACFTST